MFPLAGAAQGVGAAPDWRVERAAGIGVMGNAPRALAGGMAWLVTPAAGGLGFFIEGRTTHRSYEGQATFLPGVSAEQAEAQFSDIYMQTVEHWQAVNAGVVRPLTADLSVYAGAGYGRQRNYREYVDQTGQRGEGGVYRALVDGESGGRLNATGGTIVRFGRGLAFMFGVESAPLGFTAGVSIVFQ